MRLTGQLSKKILTLRIAVDLLHIRVGGLAEPSNCLNLRVIKNRPFAGIPAEEITDDVLVFNFEIFI
ncbi:Uncharacterised protein [Klebsiella pneumoniae]|nr:Uncharacterised protein [Klebsiella pneumoniae]